MFNLINKIKFNRLRSSTKDGLCKFIFETEEKIHRAIKENDTDFLSWFFFSSTDKNKLMKILDNQNFNELERKYLRNFLEEMGKI